MNILPYTTKRSIIHMLLEGQTQRGVARLTDTSPLTVGALAYRVGSECLAILDTSMRRLRLEQIEVDEIWGFVKRKQAAANHPNDGEQWIFIALDRKTKLIPCFHVGRRNTENAHKFFVDLASRMADRTKVASDGLRAYVRAVSETPEGAEWTKSAYLDLQRARNFDQDRTITNHVEIHNRTLRGLCARMRRRGSAFSKDKKHLTAALALYFVYYNFIRTHTTLRCTPAMEAGIETTHWTLDDLLKKCGETGLRRANRLSVYTKYRRIKSMPVFETAAA